MILLTMRRLTLLLALTAAVALTTTAHAQDARREPYRPSADSARPIIARHGMVVGQEKIATRVGADILSKGGNAVDAAVATGFAMAVTYPRAGNIGGGGFMVIHSAQKNEDVAIDYRETAPMAATRDMFLGTDGKPDNAKSRDQALGIGVPGTVAGLALALEKYGSGKFTLAELIAPAIKLAREGFVITDDNADTFPAWHARLARWPSTLKAMARNDGTALREGDRLFQADLGETLLAIAERGRMGFYQGPVAEMLIDEIRGAGGIMTLEDLMAYEPVIRQPVRGTYRGFDIVSMPLPSSGGTVLMQTLNILEGYNLSEMGAGSISTLHLLAEALKRSYADRARYLGDPAFVDAPISRLLDKDYAARLRSTIDPNRATPATEIFSALPAPREGRNTTHFSVIDRFGNAVSNTYTLNFSYGVGLVADGTGVLLNNELDDFTAAPGAANVYGLVGYEANLPGPGKRPLSSMTPTIVLKDNKPVLVTGSPGGSRIISAVAQVIVNVIDHKMDAARAVASARLHHQWLPDQLYIERGFPEEIVEALKAKGHAVNDRLGQTSANSLAVTPEGIVGAPDPRTRGAEAAGH